MSKEIFSNMKTIARDEIAQSKIDIWDLMKLWEERAEEEIIIHTKQEGYTPEYSRFNWSRENKPDRYVLRAECIGRKI